jgi:hypothetical protein
LRGLLEGRQFRGKVAWVFPDLRFRAGLATLGTGAGGKPARARFDSPAMVAAPDLTAGMNGALEVNSRRKSLLVSPIFSIPSWRSCMMAMALFFGSAAKATPAAAAMDNAAAAANQ